MFCFFIMWLVGGHWSLVTGNAIFNNQYSVCVCDHESVVRKQGQAIINFQYSIINGWGRMKDEEEEEGGRGARGKGGGRGGGEILDWRMGGWMSEVFSSFRISCLEFSG